MISIENLQYAVSGRPLLRGVSLEVKPGEMVGLIGPNGSGKSTLLRCASKQLHPQSGRISIDGQDLSRLSAPALARRLAVVAQEHEAAFDFTVEEVVMMGRTAGRPLLEGESPEDREAVAAALDRVGLLPLAQRSYLTLSGGEKQRVMLSRAIAQDTPYLLLDEPTNHLDLGSQLRTLSLLSESGKGVLCALHDLALSARFCKRLYVLLQGQVIAQGRPEDLITPDLIRTLYGLEGHPFHYQDALYLHISP